MAGALAASRVWRRRGGGVDEAEDLAGRLQVTHAEAQGRSRVDGISMLILILILILTWTWTFTLTWEAKHRYPRDLSFSRERQEADREPMPRHSSSAAGLSAGTVLCCAVQDCAVRQHPIQPTIWECHHFATDDGTRRAPQPAVRFISAPSIREYRHDA